MKTDMLLFVAALMLWTATAAAQEDPVAPELKKLEGTYRLVRGEESGKPLPDELVKNPATKLTITGAMHVVQLGDETIRGTHTVNPLETPKSITASDTTGRFAGKMTSGIYKLDGDEFTVCFAPPGEQRPAGFVTKDFPGRLLHVWKKMK